MMSSIRSNYPAICIMLSIMPCWGGLLYYYDSFIGEEIMPPTKIASLDGKKFDFTITAACRSVKLSSPTPYVSVQVRNVEILSAAVGAGYDFTHDCVISSIAKVDLSADQKRLLIYMKNGTVKEINLPVYKDSNDNEISF